MSRMIDAYALLELYDGCEGLRVPVEVVIQNVKDMPTVAEPVRHGHWTWYYTDKQELSYGSTEYTPMFECSVCGHHYESYRRYDEPHKEDADYPKYCENCGAKMDEKEQEEDK